VLKNKTWVIVLGVSGALVLLLGGVGVAYAQWPQPPADGQSFFGEGRFPGKGMLGGRFFGGGPMRGGRFQDGHQSLVTITAELTGLSEDEVIAALEDGQTFAEIAEAEGIDPQAIVDAAIAEAETRLQEAVDEGLLTEERMDQVLERLTEELPERLEQPWEPGGPMGGGFGPFGEGFWTMYDEVAAALELTPEELFNELHAGKTLAEIADEQGVEMEAVRDAMEAARGELMEEAIARAVENGRMTQEQADWLLEGLEKGFVPAGRGFSGRCGGRPGRGGRGRGMGW
jgi:predicted DNA-binding protein YlxM (UPF0122 family)